MKKNDIKWTKHGRRTFTCLIVTSLTCNLIYAFSTSPFWGTILPLISLSFGVASLFQIPFVKTLLRQQGIIS